MKPELYIRDDKSVSKSHPGFHSEGVFPSYHLAVIEGQKLGGYGNFYVYIGESFCPSREDQLLLEPRKRKRGNPKLKEAQLQD